MVNDSVCFVCVAFLPPLAFVPFARCAGFNVCVVREYQVLQHYLLPSIEGGAGGGSVSYRKDTTSEGRFATFRPCRFKINIRQYVIR